MPKNTQNQGVSLNDHRAIAPQIYAHLRAKIVHAELLPGEVMSETEIARYFGVSRQPVREAFIKLAESGLVQVRPQRGTMVSRISKEAVMDARFVREAIEADVVKIVAERCDEAIARELRGQVVRQKCLTDPEIGEFVHLDEVFHQTLAEVAGRPNAWRVVEDFKAQMDRVRFLSDSGRRVQLLISQHHDIVEAIARNDVAKAEAAMRKHLREIIHSLPELERDRPELFAQPS